MDPLTTLITMAAVMTLGAVAAAIGRLVSRDEPSLLAPLALAVACAMVTVQQEGWPTRAPDRGALALTPMWTSILVLAAALAIAALCDALAGPRWQSAFARPWTVAFSAGALILAFLRLPSSGALQPMHLAAISVVPLILLATPLARRHHGFGWLAAMAFSFAGLGLLILQSGFAKVGVISGGVGASLGAAAIVSWLRPVGLGVAANGTALALLVSFAAIGRTYVDDAQPQFPAWLWVLPVAAPMAAWVAEIPSISRYPRLAAIARVGLPAAVAFVAVGLAVALAPASESDPYR